MNHPNLLTALNQAGALRTLDLAFAQSLQRLAPDTDPQVLAGAALASLAVTSGHAGLDPTRAAMLLDAREGPSPALPDPTDWQRTLAASRWVDQPNPQEPAAADCPLVLEHGLLYLRRYREYERRLALGLQRIAAHSPPPFAAATLAPLFEQLFPQASLSPRERVPEGRVRVRACPSHPSTKTARTHPSHPTTKTTKPKPPPSPYAAPCCWSPAAPAPARPPPSPACCCCASPKHTHPTPRPRASPWPHPPAAPPSAWPKACAPPSRAPSPTASTRPWPTPCPPVPAPCIACSASSRTPRSSATPPTTRCHST